MVRSTLRPTFVVLTLAVLAGCAAETGESEPAPGGSMGFWPATVERGTGVFRIEGEEHELSYLRAGDEMIYEHDIVLDAEDEVTGEPGRRTEALFAVSSESRLWPEATVPYVIADSVTTPARVRNAMAVWEAVGIRFVPRTDEQTYLVVRERDQRVCSASVGYVRPSGDRPAVRYINLRDTSRHAACPGWVIVHEIGHTLGLWHEQTRPLRDEHVRILWGNIEAGYADQFEVGVGRRLGEYDIASTMHYHSNMLSNGDGPTIVRLDGSRIGHDWSTLSDGDIAGIRELYFGGTPVADGPAPDDPEPDDGPPDLDLDLDLDEGDLTVREDITLGTPAATLPGDRVDPPALENPRLPAPPPGMSASCSVGTATAITPAALAFAALLLGLLRRRGRRSGGQRGDRGHVR